MPERPSAPASAVTSPPSAPALTIEAFLAGEGPILDVRSPGEFARGHIPGARNLPLFDDEERSEIGTLYKQSGRRVAVQRGLERVGPRLASLAEALRQAADAGGEAPLRLHCWRGGMRSGSVAWLAGTLELPVVLLEGGYKAWRRRVLERFERPWPLHLLGGRTGCAKTELLLALRQRGVAVIDLEGRAHHRGSSFGALGLPPQPSTEHYENLLAADLDALEGAPEIWLEAAAVPAYPGAAAMLQQGQASSLAPANARALALLEGPVRLEGGAAWCRQLLIDPQTCGPLLAALPAEQAPAALAAVRQAGFTEAALIGRVVGSG